MLFLPDTLIGFVCERGAREQERYIAIFQFSGIVCQMKVMIASHHPDHRHVCASSTVV